MAILADSIFPYYNNGTMATWIILVIPLVVLLYQLRSKRHVFPVVNAFPWDFTQRKAFAAYMQDSKSLTRLAKKRGPITIKTPSGPRIVLPSSLTSWVKSNKDLDHQEMARREYFADYPGFEGNAMIHDTNNVVIDTVKRHLSQNARLVPVMNEHAGEALDELWTREHGWHTIDWSLTTTSLISRVVASVLVGPDMAKDAEWQRMTTAYATSFFSAVFEMKRWPSYLRPVVHWFLPAACTCRELVKDVRKAADGEKAKRRQAKANGMGSDHLDAITWSEGLARGEELDQGAVQLGFAVAALHTTSEQLRQVLLDVCQNPDLMEPLREELKQAVRTAGASLVALSNMALLDSVLKESQRLHPPVIVNLERVAIRNTYLPDGTLIPRGTVLNVDGSDMWDAEIYPDPHRFDGYRFFKMREAGDDRMAFVSSTKEQCVFGMGRHICPGRFLAAVDLKLCLAHILLKYDIRLKEGYVPVSIKNGFYQMVDPLAQVEVKRREEDESVLDL